MNRGNVDFDTAVKILRKMTSIGTVIFTIENLDYLKREGALENLLLLLLVYLIFVQQFSLKMGNSI